MTKVPAKAACWSGCGNPVLLLREEYCIYISDNECGLYKADGTKRSAPFGMAVQKVFGDSGNISIKIARSLLNNTPAIRYTLSTFDPNNTIGDTHWQGGSSATDVFPGTPATFGGEINGYGEISSAGILSVTEYTIYYIYDGIDPIVEYPASGNPLASYVNAGGLHIGKIAGADSSWYHCDALGSPRKMTDELGTTVTWSGSYYPFSEAAVSGTRTNTHQFTGKEMDSEMGLNYFCQRYYDPQIGRFMSLDPQDSPASSPYAYCANNPLKFTDPTGEKYSYMEQEERTWALCDRAMWQAGQPDLYSTFASWPGSLLSYMEAHPEFYEQVLLNEYISQMRFYFAKNDYFRMTEIINGERITTEYFFNPITMGVGMTTITEQLGCEVALNLAQMNLVQNMASDIKQDFGPLTVLKYNKATMYNMGDEKGLIVDEVFWGAVSCRLGFGLRLGPATEISINTKSSFVRVISRKFGIGFRLDKAHHAKGILHWPWFWSW